MPVPWSVCVSSSLLGIGMCDFWSVFLARADSDWPDFAGVVSGKQHKITLRTDGYDVMPACGSVTRGKRR